jgi:pimeloyl-ACP methyl ester carboxylesterase
MREPRVTDEERAMAVVRFTIYILRRRTADTGHFSHLEQPTVVSRLIEEWLAVT